MKQKETLWTQVYIETIKKKSPIQAESAATQAVEAFEKRFERYTIPKFDIDKKDVDPSFTQAGRLKRLFEELDIAVECGSDEDESFIMVLDWVFHFKNGAFKNVKVI